MIKQIKILHIKENIKEKDFPEYIKNIGYDCLRLAKRNNKKIKEIVEHFSKDISFEIEKDYNLVLNIDLFGIGKPDFFIWSQESFYFCEFKSLTDVISNEQFNWYMEHIDYPIMIAKVFSVDEDNIKPMFSWKKYISKETKQFFALKDLVIKRCISEHPKLAKSLTEHTDKDGKIFYTGIIPAKINCIITDLEKALKN